MINRRQFLASSGALIAAGLGSRQCQAEDTATLKIGVGPHLLIDDHLIESQSRIERVVLSPTRFEQPIITGRDDGNFQPYVSVVRDLNTRRFRMWYGVPAKPGVALPSHLAYIESADGVHWERPHRVLDDPGGLEVRFGASVVDEGPGFGDASQRYKFGFCTGAFEVPPTGGLMIATSPDGLAWTPVTMQRTVVLPHTHDINNIFRDEVRGRYAAIVSMLVSAPGHYRHRRITCQSVSDDLIDWATPWPVLVPDEHDEPNTEFYAMSGFLRRGDLLIGLVKVLRDDLPADEGGESQGVGYTTLAWSRDGVTWSRDRTPFMPRNPAKGTWDHAMTWADCQVPVNDELFIYYGGYARGHKVERFTERQIGLARLQRDRYVARHAGAEPATLRTKVMQLHGKSVSINACINGRCAARLLDDKGGPVTGFDAIDLEGDSLAHRLPWDISRLRDQRVRLDFSLRDASLFAIEIAG